MGWRILIVLLGVVVAAALYLALREDDAGEREPGARTATRMGAEEIVIQIDAQARRVMRVPVPRGKRVVLVIRGRAGDEVHLHGYDRKAAIPARIAFRATIPGRFEVELEESGRQVAELTVGP